MKPALKKRTRKLIFSFLLFFLLLPLLAKPVAAFSTPSLKYGAFLQGFEGAVFKTQEMNLQSFVNETFKSIIASIITTVMGCTSCDYETRSQYPGLLSSTARLIASTYSSPPASGVRYMANLGEKIGLVKPVYAQESTGFQLLEVILPIWEKFRNVTYILIVLIIIFVGFAIMFRMKINPQTVISIQSALPKIVMVLILITFSYAIAGFLIDLGIVIMFLINSIFGDILVIGEKSIAEISEIVANAIRLPGSLLGIETIMSVDSSLFIQAVSTHVFFIILAPFLSFFLVLSLGPLGILFNLAAIILMAIAAFRISWLLIKTYALIVISVIFAPFQILMGAFPGSQAIGSWFKNLLAQIAVFPTTIAMAYLGSFLILEGALRPIKEKIGELLELLAHLVLGATRGITNPKEVVDILAALADVLTNTEIYNYFAALLLCIAGLAIFMMIPKAADMIKAFITGQQFQFGGTITSAAVGPIALGYKTLTTLGAGRKAWTDLTRKRGKSPEPADDAQVPENT